MHCDTASRNSAVQLACQTCSSLASSEPNADLNFEVNARKLLETARSGCAICKLLGEASDVSTDVEDGALVQVTSKYDSARGKRGCLQIQVYYPALQMYIDGWVNNVEIYTEHSVPHSPAFPWLVDQHNALVLNATDSLNPVCPCLTCEPQISFDSSSASCMQLAKGWLDQCIKHHSKDVCISGADVRLPTRVIAVGDDATSPFLYEPAPNETGRYATLSYCWGETESLITTTFSLQARKEGFKLEALPKTLEDAVIVTRALSIPYLWIDSLCIVQDSKTDWETEASKMSTVYGNALLTIAAMNSEASDTGLFLHSKERESSVLKMELGQSGKIYKRASRYQCLEGRNETLGSIHTVPLSNVASDKTVLSTRGWTLQELKLSQRLLLFSAHEMGWLCRTGGACECQTDFRAIDGNSHGMLQFAPPGKGTLSRPVENIITKASSDALNSWLGLVENFTARKLSESTDRLPAFSGVAESYHSLIGARYVGGIWLSSQWDITCQMLWESTPFGQPLRLANYAPSWSWASMSGRVTFLYWTCDLEVMWRIKDVQYTPHGSNEYGPGTGSMTIEGLVLPLVPHWDRSLPNSCIQYYAKGTEGDGHMLVFENIERVAFDEKSKQWEKSYVQCLFPDLADAEDFSTSMLSKQELARHTVSLLFAATPSDNSRFAALLVAPVADSSTLIFYRLGIVDYALNSQRSVLENKPTWVDIKKLAQRRQITLI